eukprot:jgi/Mesvir1/18552/Mv17069-RA.1
MKKKKLDTRFPAARIKKIMQTDDEVGKIALATPVLISKSLELFLQDLCDKAVAVASARGARTLNSSHVKACILGESKFDFLTDLVAAIPDNAPAEGGRKGRRATGREDSGGRSSQKGKGKVGDEEVGGEGKEGEGMGGGRAGQGDEGVKSEGAGGGEGRPGKARAAEDESGEGVDGKVGMGRLSASDDRAAGCGTVKTENWPGGSEEKAPSDDENVPGGRLDDGKAVAVKVGSSEEGKALWDAGVRAASGALREEAIKVTPVASAGTGGPPRPGVADASLVPPDIAGSAALAHGRLWKMSDEIDVDEED